MKISDLFEKFDRYELHDLTAPKSSEIDQIKSTEHLVKVIEENCSEMLNAYRKTGKVLYRGMNVAGLASNQKIDIPTSTALITGIRTDRRPVQMGEFEHEQLDRAFRDLGINTTRKNSIFVSAQQEVASVWGKSFVVFVKDGWEGMAFKESKNTYSFYNLQSLSRDFYYEVNRVRTPKNKQKAYEEFKYKISDLGPFSFKNTDGLVPILEDDYYEALISGDSYIAVRLPYFRKVLAQQLGIEVR